MSNRNVIVIGGGAAGMMAALFAVRSGARVVLLERNEKLGYRIREAQLEKVPYLVVLGKNEVEEKSVSYRLHGEQKSTTVPREDFLAMLKDDIATKKINPASLK